MSDEHFEPTFFGYTDVVWSTCSDTWLYTGGGTPSLDTAVLKGPGWLAYSRYGFGDTASEALQDLQGRSHVLGTVHVRQTPEGWTATSTILHPLSEAGTWEEVLAFSRRMIREGGPTDHVFLETARIVGRVYELPVYELGFGS